MSRARGIKSPLVAAARAGLRRLGLELHHHASDPVLQGVMQVRETLRVTPQAAPWVWDHLLSNVAAKAHLRNLLRVHEIDLVLDIGANRGQFGRTLRELGYEGQIISFEPTEAAFRDLQAAAHADAHWEARRLALGDTEAQAEINVYRSSEFSSLHAASAEGRSRFAEHLDLDHIETVDVRRLDTIIETAAFAPAGARMLLKTDTQGHDLAVLRGAQATLSRTRAVLTEATVKPIYDAIPTYRDIIDFLGGNGFDLSGLYPISHEHDLSLIELDCFFVRRNQDAA